MKFPDLGIEWVVAVLAPWTISPHPNFGQKEITPASKLALVTEFRVWTERARYEVISSAPNDDLELALVEQAAKSLENTHQAEAAEELWRLAFDTRLIPGARVAAALYASVAYGELELANEAAQRVIDLAPQLRSTDMNVKSPSFGILMAALLQQLVTRLQDSSRFREAEEYTREILRVLPAPSANEYEEFEVSKGISWGSSRVQKDVIVSIREHAWATRSSLEGMSGNLWTRVVRSRQGWIDSRIRSRAGAANETVMENDFEATFESLSGKRTFGKATPAEKGYASLLLAELSGHPGLRNERESLGKILMLAMPTSVLMAQEALRLLRQSQRVTGLQPAVTWIRNQGPTQALVFEAQSILQRAARAEGMTEADLVLLEAAAEFLAPEDLSSGVRAVLTFPQTERVWGKVGWSVYDRMWKTLARLLEGSNNQDDVASQAARALIAHEVNDVLAGSLSDVLNTLEWEALSDSTRNLFLEWLKTPSSPDVDLRTIRALVSKRLGVDETPPSDYQGLERIVWYLDQESPGSEGNDALIETYGMELGRRLRDEAKQAQAGVVSFGGLNTGEVAAAFAERFEDAALWRNLSRYLANQGVDNALKERALERIAARPTQVPAAARKLLANAWPTIVDAPQTDHFLTPSPLPVFPAALRAGGALQLLTEQQAMERVMQLAAYNSKGRVEAARSIPFVLPLGDATWGHVLLAQMSYDESPEIRGAAGRSLVLTSNLDTPLSSQVISRVSELLASDGIRVPLAILHGFQQLQSLNINPPMAFREPVFGRTQKQTPRVVRKAAELVMAGWSN
ncbi:hypothetical protein [Frondihabitans sp. Leaf304]|uniref:hypothetical protein n=1 Tax=Frondihabitans sp. Leaf304 TaxID=1736329 RepID=UPI0012FA735E|nr:hypothetical protein [Frondihabitans sp. Leaf304]